MAIAGPIAFVGLIVPHIARALVGADYRWVVPVLGADRRDPDHWSPTWSAALVARPDEIQVGIVMAVVGVPVFIALVRRRKLAEL